MGSASVDRSKPNLYKTFFFRFQTHRPTFYVLTCLMSNDQKLNAY